MTSLVQKRAQHAARRVSEVSQKETDKRKAAFRSRALEFPVFLRTDGALRAMLFLKSKGKDDASEVPWASLALYEALTTAPTVAALLGKADCVTRLAEAEPQMYRRLEDELVEVAVWIKRFSAAELKDLNDGTTDAAAPR